MLRKISGIAAVLLLSAAVASASAIDKKDLQVINDIQRSVNKYAYFTIFDDVNVAINNGVVTLTGAVTQPYKKDEIEKRVAKVDGVSKVQDHIAVLPVSQFDNQLRYRLARVIYGNPNLQMYGLGANPSIHIVVDHGHVTLTGVVNNDFDRTIAGTAVAGQFGVMSVKNDLKTNAEVKDALEKSKS
jgi:hyperosmotically inducible protein